MPKDVSGYTVLVLLLASIAFAAGDPTFSVERGVFDAPFTLEVALDDAAATLLVSVDGTEPTLAYAGPIEVDGTVIVRAVEVDADGTRGATMTHTYLFPADIVQQTAMDPAITSSAAYQAPALRTLAELPSVSIVSASSLWTTKVQASAEWIDPSGDDLQVNCAVARTGTTSLGYPKTSLRLYFNGDFGPTDVDFDFWSLDEPGIAPSSEQDALSLRSGHDSVFYLGAQGQYTRNDWMDASQLEMGHTAPHGRFAHVYENGSYIGIYHVRERFNADFLSHYLGGDDADYESVNEGTVKSGSGAGWAGVIANKSDVAAIQDYLRLDHYLDYMVLNYYAGNTWDWTSYHNWAAAGPSQPDSGGFRFYSSDSDICIYYDYTVNALYLPGPADIFPALYAAGDPDFRVALADAIHRNLESGGPLTAARAGERYERIADSIEEAVVAESARWGYGWWDRDGEWTTERDRLLNSYFPYRTDELLRQMKAAGWYPVPAPILSIESGELSVGDDVSVEVPDGLDAELWLTTDGTDPRRDGGEPAPSAILASGGVAVVTVEHGTVLRARLRVGETWGPVEIGEYTVSEPSPLVLNEWNAVAEAEVLDVQDFDGSGADDALGVLAGNGGAWIELVVTRDLDLRGWRFAMADLRGPAGEIVFSDADNLARVRAGTLLTVSMGLPEDAGLDPDGGDWRAQLTATPAGEFARSEGFRVSAQEWQLTAWDADGYRRFGPVGEGVAPRRGIGSHAVGALLVNPSASTAADSADYGASTRSTYAAPNLWDGGGQDLSALRGEGGGVLIEADTALPEPTITETTGCASAPGAVWLGWLVGLLVIVSGCRTSTTTSTPGSRDCFADRDADGHGDAATAVACENGVSTSDDCDDTNAIVSPSAPEVCNGLDDDCDALVDDADTVVDALPFYSDGDGDGWGDEDSLVHACEVGPGAAIQAGDCDDADATIHPGAEEACNDIDRDCDGVENSGFGSAPACAATTCAEILAAVPSAEDGAYWLDFPSGTQAEVWCDMATGGWTLAFNRNTTSTGSQGTFGAGEVALDALAMSPELASASATPAMGWADIEALAWSELRVSAAAYGSRTYTSRTIPRSELRVRFGEPGYLLFGGETGYYWCGGPASYTDAGVGAVNNPAGATLDCKSHGSLGSGWDFSEYDSANAGLTLCGGDASYFLAASWGGTWISYGNVGGAEALWVR